MRIWWVIAGVAIVTVLITVMVAGCNPADREAKHGDSVAPAYVATIAPLGMILSELATGRATVTVLLEPGQSPHTYDPGPADMRLVSAALVTFYAHETIDAWALDLAEQQPVCMYDLLPPAFQRTMPQEHDHKHDERGGEHGNGTSAVGDGHFWNSPRTVSALLPALTAELARLDPDGAGIYRANAAEFTSLLAALEAEAKAVLEPYHGRYVLLFHPSFIYLLADYGLELGGLVEPSPGKEPSPRRIVELTELAAARQITAVFTEPQLPESVGDLLASEMGLPLLELDPLGGVPGRQTYAGLVRYNVSMLAAGLSGRGAP